MPFSWLATTQTSVLFWGVCQFSGPVSSKTSKFYWERCQSWHHFDGYESLQGFLRQSTWVIVGGRRTRREWCSLRSPLFSLPCPRSRIPPYIRCDEETRSEENSDNKEGERWYCARWYHIDIISRPKQKCEQRHVGRGDPEYALRSSSNSYIRFLMTIDGCTRISHESTILVWRISDYWFNGNSKSSTLWPRSCVIYAECLDFHSKDSGSFRMILTINSI